MPGRRTALHVVRGPFHGPWLCSVCAIRRDLPHLSHVVADISPFRQDGWARAVSDVQRLCDGYSASTGAPCRHGLDLSGVAFAVLHDVTASEFEASFGIVGGAGFPVVEWDYGHASGSPSASCGLSRSAPRVWPMLDVSRLMCVEGRPSEETVAVLLDPGSGRGDPGLPSMVFPDPRRRVLSYGDGDGPGSVPWRFGAEWSAGSLCGVVVATAGLGYPFVLASCMAMGRACVCLPAGVPVPDGSYGGLVSDGRTCLLASSPADAGEKASWLMSHPSEAASMGARAVYAALAHDRDPNLLAFRGALGW